MTNELTAVITAYRAANDETARLRDLKATKEAELAGAAQAHQELAANMGERILEATLLGESTQQAAIVATVAQGETALKAIEQLLVALDSRIANAVQAENSAKANCMKAEAEQCRAEATERKTTLDALLTELAVYEGCEFEPKRSASPIVDPKTLGGDIKIISTPLGRTQALFNRAANLIEAAKFVERGEAIPWSIVTGDPIVIVPNYLEG